jgi:hypothetical protein
MSSFCVWCQGGEANGFRYWTCLEPGDEIALYRIPGESEDADVCKRWCRILLSDNWPGVVYYVRVAAVEQIADEYIYYQK